MGHKKLDSPSRLGNKVKQTKAQPFRLQTRKQTIVKARQQRHNTLSSVIGPKEKPFQLGYAPQRALQTAVARYQQAAPATIAILTRRHDTHMARASAWQRLIDRRGESASSNSIRQKQMEQNAAAVAARGVQVNRHFIAEYPKFKRNMKAMGM